jgi:hypothetical protein
MSPVSYFIENSEGPINIVHVLALHRIYYQKHDN